ncbi:MAG: UDP-3-O-[3-hydroxymyristoyl] glucosamine N-acyltransferase [Halocynthiibacter sp.]|jgi:acyl-[acyl carrier protein]--UDP-N-acetylglucosamine O-acyltransferase
MFTGRTLPMKDISGQFGLTVKRSCEFSYVGKLPTRLALRVVPCTRQQHIEQALTANGVAGIITFKELASHVPETFGLAYSENPLGSAMALQSYIAGIDNFQWESFESRIHPTAVIHQGASVAPRDVVIGAGTIIYPNAVILPRSIIGKNCSIGPGTVVSTEAFEVDVSRDPHVVCRQSGGVRIADNVDVQANCTLVRSTFGGFTELGEGTKLDCQVHFAHDCRTGCNVRIAACAEISGRVEIGDRAFIGPNVSISNGITIQADAKVSIGAVVTRDVSIGETVTGNFAVAHRKWISFMRTLK